MEYYRLRDIDIEANVGNRLYLLFIARDVIIKPQKDGKEFMILSMVDQDKVVEAKIFGVTQTIKNKVIEGKVYEGIVDIRIYKKNGKESVSCIIYDLTPSNYDPSFFADWVENLQQYSDKLGQYIEMVKGTVYGDIMLEILTPVWQQFACWPAATGQHHTQLGGLLFHTATVVEDVVTTARIYQQIYGEKFINIPLLISAAILHDTMKTKELKVDTASGYTEYSNTAALSTHIMDLLTEIEIVAANKGIRDSEEVKLLKHVIAAHHGRLEWGSPISMNTPEAYILCKMDELDAEMWRYNKEFKNTRPGEYSSTWRVNNELTVRYKDSTKG